MNRFKRFAVGIVFGLLICLMPISAYASDTISFEKFDEIYYAQNNPDVVAVLGADKSVLYDHYIQAGIVEGRKARAYLPSRFDYLRESNFNYQRYATDYPELAQILGVNSSELWNHYKNNGFYEGLKGYSTDDRVNAYLKCFDVVDSIITPGMNDYDKAKAIHDWICNNTDYDYSFNSVSYGITGTMLYGTSVCSGYADAFNFMAQISGLESQTVTGEVNNGVSSGGHAWNRVYSNGAWHYIDATWDDFTNKYGMIIYACFWIDETEMNRIHNGCRANFMNGQFIGYY